MTYDECLEKAWLAYNDGIITKDAIEKYALWLYNKSKS